MKYAKYLLANALILVVLYGNSAIIVNHIAGSLSPWRVSLPMGRHLYDTFILFAVYSFRVEVNCDIEIYGVTAPDESYPEGKVIKLEVADYLPFRPMEVQGRLLAVRHLYMQGSQGQREAWRGLAAKIRGRYNRSNPEEPLGKVVFVELYWSRDFTSPEFMKVNERLRILYSG